jgi:hypothetical protein
MSPFCVHAMWSVYTTHGTAGACCVRDAMKLVPEAPRMLDFCWSCKLIPRSPAVHVHIRGVSCECAHAN